MDPVNPKDKDIQSIIYEKVKKVSSGSFVVNNEIIYCTRSLSQFYHQNNYRPVWRDTKFSYNFLSYLKEADNEGLSSSDYHLGEIKKLMNKSNKSADQISDLDLLTTDAFLLYSSHLLSGKLDPVTVDPIWHVSPKEGNPGELLFHAMGDQSFDHIFREIIPKHPIYKGLKTAYKNYKSFLNREECEVIQYNNTIKPGDYDTIVFQIRKSLIQTGDLENYILGNTTLYDSTLLKAIKRFQVRHGLLNDGIIGKETFKALNVPLQVRIDQIRVNMERWRWLSRDFNDYYIRVNIADFSLDVIRDGHSVRNHKVIVGRPYRKTPVFSSKMTSLVFNPSWFIPPNILKKDILPEVRNDPGYLKNKKILVTDSQGNAINPYSVDWSDPGVIDYNYRQSPGIHNALGAVKFNFPNKFTVYMHDTPSRELFEKSERAFSSGCIRVQNALELAEFLINDPEKWNREKIFRVVNTGNTTTVSLKNQPGIYMLYWTAWSEKGEVNFRKDIYHRDDPILRGLKSPPKSLVNR
jgi:murein L,D-transpeptidase YcbB/YkuD